MFPAYPPAILPPPPAPYPTSNAPQPRHVPYQPVPPHLLQTSPPYQPAQPVHLTPSGNVANQPAQNQQPAPQPKKTEWLGRLVIVVAAVAVAVAVAYGLYELTIYISDVVRDKFSKQKLADLEAKARKKGLGHLVDKVKQIPSINKRIVVKRLAACKAHEEKIFKDLEEHFVFRIDHLKEMLMGAHIRLDDKGVTYDAWKKIDGIKTRMSSHASDGAQFSIKGSLIKEMLCGDITESGKKFTWYQLENHPVSFGSIGRHMIDYVKYKICKANQGPYGSSRVTDKKPLLIAAKAA